MVNAALEERIKGRLPAAVARLREAVEGDRDVAVFRQNPYAPDAARRVHDRLASNLVFRGLAKETEHVMSQLVLDFFAGRRHERNHDYRAYMKELLGVLASTAVANGFRQKNFISLASRFLFYVFPDSTLLYDKFSRRGLMRLQLELHDEGPKYFVAVPTFSAELHADYGEDYLDHYVAALYAEYAGFEAAALYCFGVLHHLLEAALAEADRAALERGPYSGEALDRRLFDLLLMDLGGRWPEG